MTTRLWTVEIVNKSKLELYNYSTQSKKLNKTKSHRPINKTTKDKLVPIVFAKLFSPNNKPKTIKALLYSGATGSLLVQRYVDGQHLTREKDTSWRTAAGDFHTDGIIKAEFAIPELNLTSKVSYDLHVASNLGPYDIILGRDVLRELGIVLDFNMQIVIWNHACISMKPANCKINNSWAITYPEEVDDMVSRLTREQYRNVIDAKYKKANLNEVLENNYEHLSNKQ